jgi:hypothetical protein
MTIEFKYNSYEGRLESSDSNIFVACEYYEVHGKRKQSRPYSLHYYNKRMTFNAHSERINEGSHVVTRHRITAFGFTYDQIVYPDSDHPWMRSGYKYRFLDRSEQEMLMSMIIAAMSSFDLINERPKSLVRVEIGPELQEQLDNGTLLATQAEAERIQKWGYLS